MIPAEIIARAICERVHGGNDVCHDDEVAAYAIVDFLTRNGYRILGPDDFDKRTLEAAAEAISTLIVEEHHDFGIGHNVGVDSAIACIPSLPPENNGGAG